jgi:hypothetical protein
VRVLEDGVDREAGRHAAEWDGRDQRGAAAASGVYFYRFRAADYEKTGRMVLLK